jgi:8-oxo-dGTP pyrophosphatase MutT (NUDIX family)
MRYSAAAILTMGDRYVLQLRDASAAIAFPAHWGLFGGEVDKGEHPLDAIRREVNEELALDVAEWREVGSFPYAALSGEPSHSVVFAADITDRWASHVLREGQAVGIFNIDELPTPIIPLALALLSDYHATRPQRVAP